VVSLSFVRVQDENHWVVIGDAADRPGLAFQLAPDLQPPSWPGADPPQQTHLDIAADDIEQAEKYALSLGAVRLPGGGATFPVYSGPSGHPFCLCL
jgi:Glyoxalase-like domain